MVYKIDFEKIIVNTLEENSGIFIGKTTASGWDANSKTQKVIETIEGSNEIDQSAAILYDNDFIDTVIVSSDKMITAGRGKNAIFKKRNKHTNQN